MVPAPETGNPAWGDRRRWRVCGLLLIVTIISYIDRQAISITAPVLAAQFHFSNLQIATIINAFIVVYMVGQLLAGRFIDRVGAKFGFSLLVTAWSLAAALTSLGTGALSFSAFRAALGLAEGVNFPGGVKVIAEWFAPRERATAVGIFTSGASIGAIVTPPLLAYVIVTFGWQAAFIVTGIPGLIWVFFWRRTYRPAASVDDRGASPVACTHEEPTPWIHFMRQRMVWGVFLARFLEEPVSWFYLTWLPIYLRSYRGASIADIGIALIFPFVALDIGYLAGGWISSRLINAGWPISTSRKTVMVVSALCMVSGIPAAAADTTMGFVLWVSVAMMGHGSWGSNIFTLPADFAPPKQVGTVYGMTAFGGGLGAIAFMQIIGLLTDAQHSFRAVFAIAGILPIAAAVVLLTVPGTISPMRSAVSRFR
jgi:ACS family hexuronate transporter-like MFS transporter